MTVGLVVEVEHVPERENQRSCGVLNPSPLIVYVQPLIVIGVIADQVVENIPAELSILSSIEVVRGVPVWN